MAIAAGHSDAAAQAMSEKFKAEAAGADAKNREMTELMRQQMQMAQQISHNRLSKKHFGEFHREILQSD